MVIKLKYLAKYWKSSNSTLKYTFKQLRLKKQTGFILTFSF